ncbi:MAG: aspartyl/asparaginyl beta-hydroxylase domain-containing protein [Gaiellaceae bacterium]
MLSCIRLSLSFDPRPLQADVNALPDGDWVPHFNTSYYTGDWSGVALRSVGGVARAIYPDPNPDGTWEDTEILGYCPGLAEAVEAFECEKTSVRLLRLGPGASVREHTDYNLGYEDGEVRFHVPVLTNPDAVFELEGRPLDMRPGESWYLDFNLRHRVANEGAKPRVHLVIDCLVNEWVTQMLEAGAPG